MSDLSTRFRYQLILAKVRVSMLAGNKMRLDLPGAGALIVPIPKGADVKEGDLLTLYTEVLANAK